MKTAQEIQDLIDAAMEMKNFDGMTYKDGIIAALEWALGVNEDSPIE